MSNQTAFDEALNRINTATDELERNVDVLAGGVANIEEDVEYIKGAVELVEASKGEVEANTMAAEQSASKATTEASKATQLVDDLKATAPFQEAPKNGLVYGRKDGVWEVVSSGEDVAPVYSVNGVNPNSEGDVVLTASSVGAKSESYTPTWDEVEGKPTLKAMSGVDDAPKDGSQYVRQDEEWVILPPAEQGDVALNFPVDESLNYGDESMGVWVSSNANTPASLALLNAYVRGRSVYGRLWYEINDITYKVKVQPDGWWSFDSSLFTSGGLKGKEGVINKAGDVSIAFTLDGGVYVFSMTEGWVATGGGEEESGGGVQLQTLYPNSIKYRPTSSSSYSYIQESPFNKVGETLNLSDFKVMSMGREFGGSEKAAWADLFSSKNPNSVRAIRDCLEALPTGMYKFTQNNITTLPATDGNNYPILNGVLIMERELGVGLRARIIGEGKEFRNLYQGANSSTYGWTLVFDANTATQWTPS